MEFYRGIVQDKSGVIVNGAVVTIYESDGTTIANIYDKDGAAISNPFLTGHNSSEGEYEFSAVDGKYIVNVVNGAETKNFPVSLYDDTSPARMQVVANKAAAVLITPTAGSGLFVLSDDGGAFRASVLRSSVVTGMSIGVYISEPQVWELLTNEWQYRLR